MFFKYNYPKRKKAMTSFHTTVIKIQRLWRGYNDRLKTSTPNMALLEARYGKLEYNEEYNDYTDGDGFVRYMVPV